MLTCVALKAQLEDDYDKERMHVFGYIISADSLRPVRNTHVISKMAHRGTISNRYGEFFIQAKKVDTLWVSCLGYRRRLIPVDSTMTTRDTLFIRLYHDTITLREVTVKPFYDYKTFKELVINAPTIPTPVEIDRLNKELGDPWLRRKQIQGNGMATITASPIQFLYDKYNKSARRQARLLRNRRMYNEVLREQGRLDELLPDSLDYPIDYRVYELDEEAETGKKMERQKKSYIHLGPE